MIVQIVTGIFLTFFYAPSAATAWESTRAMYLNPYTHFLLAVHYWGASAMIALVFLHLLQVLIWGAYKSPRELQWVVGVLLLLVTLVLGLTGYLLPWDMDAYFASQVSLNIAGLAPIVGPILQHIAQDGGSDGNRDDQPLLRASRVADAGRAASRSSAPTWRSSATTGRPVRSSTIRVRCGRGASGRIRCSWTERSRSSSSSSSVSSRSRSRRISTPRPIRRSRFVPYPAWYFLSLFGLLAIVPPEIHVGPLTISLELIATIIVPTLFLLVVLFIPWIDRSTTRRFGSRAGLLWATTIIVLGIVTLSIYAQVTTMTKQAAAPPSPPESVVLNAEAATMPSGGGAAAAPAEPLRTPTAPRCSRITARVATARRDRELPGTFPPLANNPVVTGDPEKVVGIVLGGLHGSIQVNGQTYNGMMPAWKGTLSNKDVADVITYIRGSLGNNKASAVTEAQVTAHKP